MLTWLATGGRLKISIFDIIIRRKPHQRWRADSTPVPYGVAFVFNDELKGLWGRCQLGLNSTPDFLNRQIWQTDERICKNVCLRVGRYKGGWVHSTVTKMCSSLITSDHYGFVRSVAQIWTNLKFQNFGKKVKKNLSLVFVGKFVKIGDTVEWQRFEKGIKVCEENPLSFTKGAPLAVTSASPDAIACVSLKQTRPIHANSYFDFSTTNRKTLTISGMCPSWLHLTG
jgi:hypothetical protein